jgi:hypothetical protein
MKIRVQSTDSHWKMDRMKVVISKKRVGSDGWERS